MVQGTEELLQVLSPWDSKRAVIQMASGGRDPWKEQGTLSHGGEGRPRISPQRLVDHSRKKFDWLHPSSQLLTQLKVSGGEWVMEVWERKQSEPLWGVENSLTRTMRWVCGVVLKAKLWDSWLLVWLIQQYQHLRCRCRCQADGGEETFLSEKLKWYTVESMLGKERCKDIRRICKGYVKSW